MFSGGSILSFFSINLFNNNKKIGRTDIKVNKNQVLVHIFVSSALKSHKYNVHLFMGDNGKIGIQKGYILTDMNGNFNNTIRIENQNINSNIENFKKISLVLLIPENQQNDSLNILGFRGEKFDYKLKIEDKCLTQDLGNEYKKIEIYDKIIDNSPDFWPFSSKIDGMKIVKLTSSMMKNLDFPSIQESIKKYAINSLKFYGFVILGRCTCGDKIVYLIGIPDKYNECQVISMANMGAEKFYPIDMNKSVKNGDPGFWIVFM